MEMVRRITMQTFSCKQQGVLIEYIFFVEVTTIGERGELWLKGPNVMKVSF